MLAKLSLRNARRQTGDYLVYFITITLAAALIYAFNALVVSPEIAMLSNGMEMLPFIITLATIVVVAILGWLVTYTQRFMLAKRSRELATYVLLGIEQKQVARMFLTENLVVGAAALLLGLLGGNLVYQVLRAVLMSLFGLPFSLNFTFAPAAIGLTAAYFALIFLFSMLLCRRKIRKMTIRDMMELDRRNEDKMVDTARSRKKMFTAAIVCGAIGVALLITGNLGLGILGAFLIILFCYGFFISFSSGVPAFFEKRTAKKYTGSTLLVFRSLSSKLTSMGITMGTIAVLFTAALIAEGSGLLFQNQFSQHEKLITNFDLYIAAPAKHADMGVYEDYIAENLEVTAEHRYTTFNSGSDVVAQYLIGTTDYWRMYDEDQVMRYSDYAALRAMLGYEVVPLREGEYILHCMNHLVPALKDYTEPLQIGGQTLKRGEMHNEILTQFRWDGNGRGYILVVPDDVAATLAPSLEVWAMMTAEPVGGTVYQDISDIRDARSDASQNPEIYDALFSKAGVKEQSAVTSAMAVFPLFYLALVLVMVAVTILTIQFLSDTKKLQKQYAILSDLGMDKSEMRKALNRHFAIYYAMPVLPPVLISAVYMFALARAFDAGIIIGFGHTLGILGLCLLIFFAVYLLYTAAAASSIKKTVLSV